MQTFKCICCGKNIEALWFEDVSVETPENGAWNGGVITRVVMPYGSKHDNETFVFGICDDCIDEKVNCGYIGRKRNI